MTTVSACLVCGGDSGSGNGGDSGSKRAERHCVDALLPVFSKGRSACQRLTGVLSADLDFWSTKSEVVCLACYHLLVRFDFLDLLIQDVCSALIGRFVSACNQSGSDYSTKKAKTADKNQTGPVTDSSIAENLSTVTHLPSVPEYSFTSHQLYKNQHQQYQSRDRQEDPCLKSKEPSSTSSLTVDFAVPAYKLPSQQNFQQMELRQHQKQQRNQSLTGPVENLSMSTLDMDRSTVYSPTHLLQHQKEHRHHEKMSQRQQQERHPQKHNPNYQQKPSQPQHHHYQLQQKQNQPNQLLQDHEDYQRLRSQEHGRQQQQKKRQQQQEKQQQEIVGSFTDPAENLSSNAPESSIFHCVPQHHQQQHKSRSYVLPEGNPVENLSTNTSSNYLPPVYDSAVDESNRQQHHSQQNLQQQLQSQQSLQQQLQPQQSLQQQLRSQQNFQQHQPQQNLQQHPPQQSLQPQHQSQQNIQQQHQPQQCLQPQQRSQSDIQQQHHSQSSLRQQHQSQVQPLPQAREENLTIGYPVHDLSTNIASSFLTYQPAFDKQPPIDAALSNPVQNLTVTTSPRHAHFSSLTHQEGHYSQEQHLQSQQQHLQSQQNPQPQQPPQSQPQHPQPQLPQSSLGSVVSTQLSTSNTISTGDFHTGQVSTPSESVMEHTSNQTIPLSMNLIVSSSASDMTSSIGYVTSPVLSTGCSSSSALIDCFNASSISSTFNNSTTNNAMCSGTANNNGSNSSGFCFSSGSGLMVSTPQSSLTTPANNQSFMLPDYIYLPEAHRPATTSLLSTLPDESFCLDYSINPPGPINLTSEILSSCQAVSPSTQAEVSPSTRAVESPGLPTVNSPTLHSLSTTDSALPLNTNADGLGLRTVSEEPLPVPNSVMHGTSSVQQLNDNTLNVVPMELDHEDHLVSGEMSLRYHSIDPNRQNCQGLEATIARSQNRSSEQQHEPMCHQQTQSHFSQHQQQHLQSHKDQDQQQPQVSQHQGFSMENTIETIKNDKFSLETAAIRITAPVNNSSTPNEVSAPSLPTTTAMCERGSKCHDICVLDKEWSQLQDDQRLRLGKFKTRSTDSPLQCYYCDTFCSQQIQELRVHVYQHHSPSLLNDSTLVQGKQRSYRMGVVLKNATDSVDCASGGRPYVCIFCDGVYKTIQSLRHHFRSAHTPNLRFSCSACGQRFRRQMEVTRHRVYHCSFSETARIYQQHREAVSVKQNNNAISQ